MCMPRQISICTQPPSHYFLRLSLSLNLEFNDCFGRLVREVIPVCKARQPKNPIDRDIETLTHEHGS